MAPRAQGLRCTFAPSALSSRLVVQVDVQVGEATLRREWMLRREEPLSTKTRQMDTGFREQVSTGRVGNRHTQEQRETQVGVTGRVYRGPRAHKGTRVGICRKQLLQQACTKCGRGVQPHLEVVPAVAVRILGGVQEDEQVLPQVPGQGGKPGPAAGWQAQLQHL